GCDAEIVKTVVRHKLIAADLVQLFSRFDAGCSEGIDAQTDRGAPRHSILDEFHLLAVPGKQERARTFETLLERDLLIGLNVKVGTHRAVGPHDADDVDTCLFTKAEVK